MANDVAAPLPDVALLRGSTITITLDVAGATITALNVHGDQFSADATEPGSYLPTGPVLVPVEA